MEEEEGEERRENRRAGLSVSVGCVQAVAGPSQPCASRPQPGLSSPSIPGLGRGTRQAEEQLVTTPLSGIVPAVVFLLLVVSIIITFENDLLEEWEQKTYSM